jgi:DNA polymerase III epsilon subunit-like protein
MAKLTAHEMATRLLARNGMKKHMDALLEKQGEAYVTDWLAVHKRETRWARARLKRGDFTFLDTETTGRDAAAEITEAAIISRDGSPVFDRLIRPCHASISAAASEVTGITDADVADAPTFADVADEIQRALTSQPRLIIYNASFDTRLLQQSAFASGLAPLSLPKVDDLMLRFARWVGAWEPKRDGYVWWRLEGGHRAAGDCRAAIRLMERMARQEHVCPL